MPTDDEVWRLVSRPQFIGDLLRYTVLLESDLDGALCTYFARRGRFQEALTLLFPELGLQKRIDILARITATQQLKCSTTALTGLKCFQEVRNKVAHRWTFSRAVVRRWLQDPRRRRMLAEYPDGLKLEFERTRHALWRLQRTAAFRAPGTTNLDIGALHALAFLENASA